MDLPGIATGLKKGFTPIIQHGFKELSVKKAAGRKETQAQQDFAREMSKLKTLADLEFEKNQKLLKWQHTENVKNFEEALTAYESGDEAQLLAIGGKKFQTEEEKEGVKARTDASTAYSKYLETLGEGKGEETKLKLGLLNLQKEKLLMEKKTSEIDNQLKKLAGMKGVFGAKVGGEYEFDVDKDYPREGKWHKTPERKVYSAEEEKMLDTVYDELKKVLNIKPDKKKKVEDYTIGGNLSKAFNVVLERVEDRDPKAEEIYNSYLIQAQKGNPMAIKLLNSFADKVRKIEENRTK